MEVLVQRGVWSVLYISKVKDILAELKAETKEAIKMEDEVHVSPEKCYATGKGLEIADPGERATVVLHVLSDNGEAYTRPVETVTGELVSGSTGEKTKCAVTKTEGNQYEISYQVTSGRRHHLHIKVEDEPIKGNPFTVTVKLPVKKLGTPIGAIERLELPWGVAVNQSGNIIVGEFGGDCVSIFNPEGGKIGSCITERTQFNTPEGVAVDEDDNILVADYHNHCIQKFTSDGTFIKAVGNEGNKDLEFNLPDGVSVHPHTRKVYVADSHNHRIQILNPDLTFYSSFGEEGTRDGEFTNPKDVAIDSSGKVYVANNSINHHIQVFTSEGKFLRKFGRKGEGNGELDDPCSIAIDRHNQVYVAERENCRVSVFTCEGEFLTSFGSKGEGPGEFKQPSGVAVDKNGVVYVADTNNRRIQIF